MQTAESVAQKTAITPELLAKYPNGNPALGIGRWQKGVSGNPGGKSKAMAECQAIARERSVEAVTRLADLIQSPDERVALMASDKILERAWGKPKEQKDEPKAALDLSKVPPEALQLIKQALAMIATATPAPRADIPDIEVTQPTVVENTP